MHQDTTTIPAREFDHNNDCIGCGGSLSANVACTSDCPFVTGEIGPAVILRAAVIRRKRAHLVPADIASVIASAAVDLVGADRATVSAAAATAVLAEYLTDEWGTDEADQHRIVYWYGLFSSDADITRSLYGAAARHDGLDFDPDDF